MPRGLAPKERTPHVDERACSMSPSLSRVAACAPDYQCRLAGELGGSKTVSIIWMTPFDASISG